jgi:uncharacterized protein YkwD
MTNPLLPVFAAVLALVVSACAPVNTSMRLGPDGRPVPTVYQIGPADGPRIQARMLDGINAARAGRGLGQVQLNDRLTSAAAAHSRDMARQGRPWHFGADGSSPLDRANRAGYQGQFLGELISETFETELETLTAWLESRETRGVLLDPQMNEIGFAWYQQPNGKLWWTLTTGRAGPGPLAGF